MAVSSTSVFDECWDQGHFAMTRRRCYEPDECEQVFDCAFHPIEPILACALNGGLVRVFRGHDIDSPLSNSTLITQFQAETRSHVSCIEWSRDGTKLAAGCFDGTVILWRTNFRSTTETKGHRLPVLGILWDPWNNYFFATRSRDEGNIQHLTIWDAETPELKAARQYELIGTKFVWDFAWVSSTRLAVCTFEGFIYVFHVGRNRPIREFHQNGVWKLCWNESLKLLISASTDGSIKLWSMEEESVAHHFKLESKVYGIDCITIPCGHEFDVLIACGLEGGSIAVYDVFNDRVHFLSEKHADAVTRLAFSPDGNFLATIDEEATLIIWETYNWQKQFQHDKLTEMDWRHLSWDPVGGKLAISNSTPEVFVVEFVEGPECQIGLVAMGL